MEEREHRNGRNACMYKVSGDDDDGRGGQQNVNRQAPKVASSSVHSTKDELSEQTAAALTLARWHATVFRNVEMQQQCK